MKKGALVVGFVMTVPIVAILTRHKQRMAIIRGAMMQQEIELEKVKQQRLAIETEKINAELKQKKLDVVLD